LPTSVFRPEVEERYRRAAAELTLPPLVHRRARRWQWAVLLGALVALAVVARLPVPVVVLAQGVVDGAAPVDHGGGRRLVRTAVPERSATALRPGSAIELADEHHAALGSGSVLWLERDEGSARWRSGAAALREAGIDVEAGRDVIVAGTVAPGGDRTVRDGDLVWLRLSGRGESLSGLMLGRSSSGSGQ
jgi:hypothetical protein